MNEKKSSGKPALKGKCNPLQKHFFYVNEIYSCLQGEGCNIGIPSVLIRFQSCNLSCSWCDSLYAAGRVTGAEAGFMKMDPDTIIRKVKSYQGIRHLIFTGGEPVLQNFHAIMQALDNTYTAEVESNATLIYHKLHKDFPVAAYSRYQWNLSPKTSNSGQKLNREALQFWSGLGREHPGIFFKFVVTRENCIADLEEILQLTAQYNIQPGKILLMPEGTTSASQVKNVWLHDICLKHNFRYTPRLHILLFDNKRGV